MTVRWIGGVLTGLLLLTGCNSGSTSNPVTTTSPGGNGSTSTTGTDSTGTTVSGPRVEDSVLGTWIVLSGQYKGDSVRIVADSLIWGKAPRINMVTSLYPSGRLRFYANGGTMGLADGGKTTTDTVKYEYLKTGDTLWLEIQTGTNAGYGVDRTSLYCWPLLPVR